MKLFILTNKAGQHAQLYDDRMYAVVAAYGREQAKQVAKTKLLGDPDDYMVEPLPCITSDRTVKPGIIWLSDGTKVQS